MLPLFRSAFPLFLYSILFTLNAGTATARNGAWRDFTYTGSIQSMVEDGPYLWLGTTGGLVRFTKATGEALTYTRENSILVDNTITTLALDSSGALRMIVDTPGPPNYDDFVSFDGSLWRSHAAESYVPECIAVGSDGALWCGYNELFSSIVTINSYVDGTKRDSFRFGPNQIGLQSLVVDAGGRLWASFLGPYSVGILRDTGWQIVAASYLLPSCDTTCILFPDGDSSMLIAGSDCLVRYDGSTVTPILPDSSTPFNGGIVSVRRDTRDRLWLLTTDHLYIREGTTWRSFRLDSLIEIDRIKSFLVDVDGIAWLGTPGGLYSFDGAAVHRFDTSYSDLPSNSVSAIAFDSSGTAWVGTQEGLTRFDGTTWSLFTSAMTGLTSNVIIDVMVLPDNSVVVATPTSISRYDGQSWQAIPAAPGVSQAGRHYYSVAVDRDGSIWASITDDLYKQVDIAQYDNTSWTIYNPSNMGLPDTLGWYLPGQIAIDSSNNVWITMYPRGVARFDGTEWTCFDRDESGDPMTNVVSVCVDRVGRVHLRAGNGMYRLKGINAWEKLQADSTLLSTAISSYFTFDQNNTLWFAHMDSGAVHYDGTRFSVYNRDNTILSSYTIRVIAFDSSHGVWFGTTDGIGVLSNGVASISLPSFHPALPNGATLALSPNPSQGRTTVSYRLDSQATCRVHIDIVDAIGRPALTCVDEMQGPGDHTVVVETSRLSPGWYALRLEYSGMSAAVPLVVAAE